MQWDLTDPALPHTVTATVDSLLHGLVRISENWH